MKSSRKREKKRVASCTENDVRAQTGDSNDKLSDGPNGTREELLQSDLTNRIFVGNISYRVSVVCICSYIGHSTMRLLVSHQPPARNFCQPHAHSLF